MILAMVIVVRAVLGLLAVFFLVSIMVVGVLMEVLVCMLL